MVCSSGNSSHGPTISCSVNSSQSPVPSCSANSSHSAPCLTLPQQGPPCQILPQQGQKVVQFTSGLRSDLTAYLQQNVQPRLPGHDKKAEEDRGTADIVSCDPPVVSPGLESSSIVNTISSSPDPSKTSLPESGLSSSLSLPHSSINSAATIEHAVGMNISDHNKVIVHPRGTKMTYPRGSIVLSISNGEWVAVQAPQSSK